MDFRLWGRFSTAPITLRLQPLENIGADRLGEGQVREWISLSIN